MWNVDDRVFSFFTFYNSIIYSLCIQYRLNLQTLYLQIAEKENSLPTLKIKLTKVIAIYCQYMLILTETLFTYRPKRPSNIIMFIQTERKPVIIRHNNTIIIRTNKCMYDDIVIKMFFAHYEHQVIHRFIHDNQSRKSARKIKEQFEAKSRIDTKQ